jgi:glycosyltransferase involved in cell wall biosynthesis
MMRSVADLALHITQEGARVEIIGPLRKGKPLWPLPPGQSEQVALEPIHHGFDPGRHFTVYRAVQDAVRRFTEERTGGSTVVHVHGVWMPANVAAWSECRRKGVAYVVSPHGMLLPQAMAKSGWRKRAMAQWILRDVLEGAAKVHVTSAAEAEAIAAISPRASIRLLPWGCNIAHPSPSAEQADVVRAAGYLGRLLPIKGLCELIDAWAVVRPHGWQLRLAGSDPEGFGAVLRDQIRRLGLTGAVVIEPPFASDATLGWLSALALFVLPSRSENFGLVVSEALSAGRPVITTTATPWSDVVVHRCGWCVSPGVDALAAAIREATALPACDLRDMGTRGRRWVEDTLAWHILTKRYWNELYGFLPFDDRVSAAGPR